MTTRKQLLAAGAVALVTGSGAVALIVTGSGAATAAPGQKAAADASMPASGYCDATTAKYLVVSIQREVPSPRCWQARPGQRLRIRDDLHQAIKVRWRPYGTVTLQAGQTVTFDRPFGSYLQPGEHSAWISAYAGGGGFELLLPGHRHVSATSAG